MSSGKTYRCGDFSIYKDYEVNKKSSTGNGINDFLIRNGVKLNKKSKCNFYLFTKKIKEMKLLTGQTTKL
jgi:hypothetical protein